MEGLEMATEVEIIESVQELSEAMLTVEEWLLRHDQLADLETCRDRTLRQVTESYQNEYWEDYFCNQRAITREIHGIVGDLVCWFLLGNVTPNMFPDSNDPSFWRVVVAVGAGGIPCDVTVFNVSAVARQKLKEEVALEDTLRSQGYLLFAPRKFEDIINWLKQKVTAGKIRLPFHPTRNQPLLN